MKSLFIQKSDVIKSAEIIGIDSIREKKSQTRIPELDGLRGVAILMVLSFHYLNNQLVDTTSQFGKYLYRLTSFGWVGVDLFFVLSGFLIGTILYNNRNSKYYFSTFYTRRIVRIIPNYYLLILVFVIIISIPYFSSDYFLTGNRIIPLWSYLLMIHNIFMGHLQNFGNTSISITWSIGIEEQFYIVFPFLVYWMKEKWLPFLLISAIIIAPIIRMQYDNWVPAYVLLPCRMDSLSFGALLAYVNHTQSLRTFAKKWSLAINFLLISDVVICGLLYYRYGDLGVFRNTLFAILFSAMLLFALVYTRTYYGALLRMKWLIWIGTISYSLYLFHSVILGICRFVASKTGEYDLLNLRGGATTIIALGISLFFSWIVFKKLETPFVAFGKRFKY